jgi:dolichyl-phosphate beta-glucosyltransferase
MQTPVLGTLAALAAATAVAAPALRRRQYRISIESSLRRTHRRAGLTGPRLTVVVPAFREERIGESVSRLRADLADLDRTGDLEIIVVDDGSGDDTADRAEAGGADMVLRCPVNRGKGAAVRVGMLSARGRAVAFTDADLAYAPDELRGLLARVEGGWDVVLGSRAHTGTETVTAAPLLRRVGHQVVRLCTRFVLVADHRDTQAGIKAFRRDVAHVIFARTGIDRFAFDIEVLHIAERYGLSVAEAPVRVENSERSTVHVVRDMARLGRDLVRIRWFGRRGMYDLHAPVGVVLAEAVAAEAFEAEMDEVLTDELADVLAEAGDFDGIAPVADAQGAATPAWNAVAEDDVTMFATMDEPEALAG